MHRGSLAPLPTVLLYSLRAGGTDRTMKYDQGFQSVGVLDSSTRKDSTSPLFNLLQLFGADGFSLDSRTLHYNLAVRALDQIAFGVAPRDRSAPHSPSSLPKQATDSAAESLNKMLHQVRNTTEQPYLVMSEAKPGPKRLYAAAWRSVIVAGTTIIPLLADRDGQPGLAPTELVFASRPLARRQSLARRHTS